MASEYSTWPGLLREWAELIGPDAALLLAEHYGGLEKAYVPRNADPEHDWAKVIGPVAWTKLVKRWGGQRVDIPRGQFIHLKKARIIELSEAGKSDREIVLALHTTGRYVRMVLEGRGRPVDSRQLTLFGRNSSG
jgi:hypothetical protein